jgi:succinoglycan biosynthesis transport protein ExoP
MQRSKVTTDHVSELDLRRVLGVLRQRGLLIGGLVAASAVAAFVVSARSPDLYESTASVRVSNPSSENVFQNVGPAPVDPRRQVETETQILQSNDIRALVEQRLGARTGEVVRTAVTNTPNTDLLAIAVTSTSSATAREAADTYADVYVQRRKERAASELDRRAGELRTEADRLGQQVRDLDAAITAGPKAEADGLRAQKAAVQSQQASASNLAFQLGAQAAIMNGAVEVADRAVPATEPVAPRPGRDAALAGLVALLAGAGAALLVDRLDDRIKRPADIELAVPEVPVLASLPVHTPDTGRRAGRSGHLHRARLPRHGTPMLVPLQSPAAEAYRTLRSNLRYSGLRGPNAEPGVGQTKRVLMVTSASEREGKTAVIANLAVALAESDQRVVVVSADLRRPTLASYFAVDEARAPGITTVLHGEAGLERCLIPVTLDRGRRLHLLPAGPVPHNPAELLGSPAMGALLAGLAGADVDYVLVDTPPVLAVSDPLAIAQHVHGVVLLAAAGRTRARNLAEAYERLDQVGADVLGVVLNGVAVLAHRRAYQAYSRPAPGGRRRPVRLPMPPPRPPSPPPAEPTRARHPALTISSPVPD